LYSVVTPVGAQTVRARASAGVDLQARFKEVEHDPKLADAILKTGRNVAGFCANCHGEGGNSLKPDVPNLAGQNSAYLIEQLRQFADGRRRNEFMEGMIKALSADEKIGVVLFYASQKVMPKSASNTALAAKGKDYYSKICWHCHGEDGRGNAQFARIAGQQPDYLRITLKRYRAGTGVRVDPLMATSTKPMTDADIDAVVEFVTSMQ
jgi:cytochrome c553